MVAKFWKEKDFDNVNSREGTNMNVVFYAAAAVRRIDCAGHADHCISINQEF